MLDSFLSSFAAFLNADTQFNDNIHVSKAETSEYTL